MGKYEGDARRLLELIGGRENIKAVTHCMTRMRFVLIDPKKSDEKQIEAIPAVKGTFTQAGQYQVIIGNDVAEFYKDFTALAGIEGVSKDEVKAAAKTNQNVAQKIMGTLGEIFAPIIPALICGGLILGFRNVIGEIDFFTDSGAFDLMHGTQSLADISQFWAGMYSFLWLIGEAVFHMLPVGICWSITRKMGTTQILGIILGLTLVSPQLLNGFSVGTTDPADIPVWDFGFFQVEMIGYQGQVIAAMMAAFVLVYLERFFKKHCPEVVSMIVVPFCSLVPAVIIAHTVVGPIGWAIGNWIGDVVYAGLFSPVRVLFAALFGALYAPLVMTGLHHMTNAIDTQLTTQYNGTPLWPMIALSNIAQGSAVLAMTVLQKKNERAQQINVPACISCYLGVTEPALFGVNLKYKFPLVCGMVGSSLAAMISVGFGVEATSIGVGGLPGILSIKPQFWAVFLAAMLVAIVVPFILTLIVGRRKLSAAELGGEQAAVAATVEAAPAAEATVATATAAETAAPA
ncbi:PTS system trehalose-specific EIIBC component, partial [Bifidobacterium phasiani]